MPLGLATLRMRSLAAVLALAAACGPALGQSRDEVLAWFVGAQAAARDVSKLAGLRIAYTLEAPATASEDQMARWREEVRHHPEHPLGQLLEQEARRRELGPDVQTEVVHVYDDLHWRHSVVLRHPGSPTSKIASARSGDARWRFVDQSLVTAGSSGTMLDDDHRLLAHTICGKLLSGSAHLGRTATSRRVRLGEANTWTISSRNDNGWEWEHTGRWLPERGVGVILEVVERPSHGRWTTRITYEDVRVRPDGLAVPAVMRTLRQGKESASETVFRGVLVERIPPDVPRSVVLRAPAHGVPDPVFDEVLALSRLVDAQTGRERLLDENGAVRETIQGPRAGVSAAPWLRGALFAIAGLAVAGLVWYKIRQR